MSQGVVSKARRARRRALVVPLLVSSLLVYVAGELVLGRSALLLPVVWLAVAGMAQTRPGQVGACWLVHGARSPSAHQRYTLAPVADVLRDHGVAQVAGRLLVGRGRRPAVHGFGPGTLVVTRGFVEHVRCGHLQPRLAAAVIAHEAAVMRAGLTRVDPALHVLLAPWRIWLAFLAIGWGVATAVLPLRLVQLCLLISWLVGLWLGWSEHPVHYAGSAVLTVAFWTWWATRAWQRARDAAGDVGLVQAGLGEVYADFLARHFTDDHTLDRAVRLRHPHQQGDRPAARPGTVRAG